MNQNVKRILVIHFFWMAFAFYANGQEQDTLVTRTAIVTDSLSLSQLDSIFSYADSLSIFTMIDSLLKRQSEIGSSLVVRTGFNSNIISAGRTIGVNQYGATAGLSYYHKTGLFLDLSSYWSQEYNPNLYLTIASLGYLKMISKHYSFLASYDRLIYNNTDINVENPLTNMVGLSNFIDFKPVTLRLDYSLYFGQQTAHRLTPGIVLSFRKYDFLGLDRISFTPAYQILFGSATITSIQLGQQPSVRLSRRLPQFQQVNRDEFGLMNYALTLPLRVTKKNWSLTASYTYNWPVALPGEDSTLPENSFISLTLSKLFNFTPRSK
ncbi:MAG: hypothetical protein ACK47E_08865 [Cyclobacteriaceae bacterium]